MIPVEELEAAYQELTDLYYSGIEEQDAPKLNAFVRDDRVLSFKDAKYRPQYVSLRQFRAECFILFGMFPEAIKECRLALAFADKNQHIEIYLLWVKLHKLQFIHTKGEASLKAIAEAIVMVCRKGGESVTPSKDAEYQKLTFVNVEAFFQMFLGQREEVQALYSGSKFTPVPISQYNEPEALPYLFEHFSQGFAVAIELKDEKLLRNLLKVISIDDQTLYGDMSLFKIFHSTLVTTMDTHPSFSSAFNQLFLMQNKTKDSMKELDFFLTSINSNMMPALEVAFNVFK